MRYDNTPYSENKVSYGIKLRINDEKLDLTTEKVLPNLPHYSQGVTINSEYKSQFSASKASNSLNQFTNFSVTCKDDTISENISKDEIKEYH